MSSIFRTPKYFSLPTWWKNITEFPAMGKSQNYWGEGMEVKYWGDVSPRNLQPCIVPAQVVGGAA